MAHKLHRVLYTSLAALAVFLVVSAAAFNHAVHSEARKQPVHTADIPPFHSLRIIDRNGILLQEVRCRDGRSEPIGLKRISSHFISALISAEDRRFYEHDGVDWKAVGRAAVHNVFTRHRRSGASTITLQLAKMLEPGPRTLGKKLHELRLAYRLEAGMTKDEILEQYISRLPFGNQLYGIEAASRTYFRKPASDLSLAQASFLAAIPNAPSQLDPFKKIGLVQARQSFILERMKSFRAITNEEKMLALAEVIAVQEPERPRLAPHFIQRLLATLPGAASRVRTTLDSRLQRAVEQQATDVLYELKGRVVSNAAVLVLDNRKGEVLAYAGSANFDDAEAEGQNDGVQALRQPGSTLKPFIYGLALERGMTPATLLQDLEVHYATPIGDFSPQNYSKQFHGPVRLREALANSLNVPAVRVTAELGPDAVLTRLRQFGFASLTADAEHYGVGLALGDGEVTLYELTRAYMGLARGGSLLPVTEQLPSASPIRRVRKEVKDRISTPDAVYLVTSILKDPYARATEFGPESVLRMPFPCAVKTGTSRNYRDNWTVGYTRGYTVGVWVGNFNGVPMQQVAGVSGAGPLFRRVMLLLHDTNEPQEFERPKGLVEVEVCALSGKKRGPDCPHGVKELFLIAGFDKKALAQCDVHRRLLVRHAEQAGSSDEYRVFEDLPPVYEPWQRQANRPLAPRESSAYAEQAVFEIVRPAAGSLYKRPLDLAPAYQTLRFEAVGAPARSFVTWSLNGKEVGRTYDRHYLDWSAETGSFRLRAETTSGQFSEVRFSVD